MVGRSGRTGQSGISRERGRRIWFGIYSLLSRGYRSSSQLEYTSASYLCCDFIIISSQLQNMTHSFSGDFWQGLIFHFFFGWGMILSDPQLWTEKLIVICFFTYLGLYVYVIFKKFSDDQDGNKQGYTQDCHTSSGVASLLIAWDVLCTQQVLVCIWVNRILVAHICV